MSTDERDSLLDDFFDSCENDKQKEEKARDIAEAKMIRECKEANDIAELNKQLEEHGIVITERVKWKPGDEVRNNAHMMIRNEWERELSRVAPKLSHLLLREGDRAFFKEMDAFNELLGRFF